jgi:YVTN family beta-propeller protein
MRPLALVVLVVLVAGCGGSGGKGQVVQFDATPKATAQARAPRDGGPRVTDTIKVGSRPHGIAVADGVVWVVTSGASKLVRIDAGTAKVDAKVDAGERPGEVAVAGKQVYVTSQDSNELLRFSTTPKLEETVALDSEPEGLAVRGSAAWVASTHPGLVTRLGAGGASATTAGDEPVQISLGDDGLWVTDAEADTVSLLDPKTLQSLAEPIGVAENPRDALQRAGDVWVVATDANRVQRIDADTLKLDRHATKVGKEPHHLAASEDALWVTNAAAGTVSRIEPSTSEVTATVKTGGTPLSIAYGAGALWVSDFGSDVVWRIDPGA